jgi:hypothetical protein
VKGEVEQRPHRFPHPTQMITLGLTHTNDTVNLEADLIGKENDYLQEALTDLNSHGWPSASGIQAGWGHSFAHRTQPGV